jgi:glycosyltransferase involved in cell wall biosynthesis
MMTPAQTSSVTVMSFHPVTKGFSREIERHCGPVDLYFDAATLRKLSIPASIRALRRIRTSRLVLALEGESARALVAPLSIAGAFTRADSMAVFWPDLRIEPITRFAALKNIWRLLFDSVTARLALARSKRSGAEMKAVKMPRQVPAAAGNRILYLDTNISLGAPVGGSIGHTAGVIDGFLQHEFEVDYASLKSMPTQKQGARWLQLRPETLLAIPPELNFYRYAEVIDAKLTPMHRARPWSFIYQRFSLHNFVGSHLGRKFDIPIVLEYNGSEAWAAKNWGTRLALHDAAVAAEDVALATADLVVAVSDQLGRELQDRGIPDERIVVYPNCVDPEVFDSKRFSVEELAGLRDRHGIARDAMVAGFIGTFGQWHGVEFLAECIRDLVRDEPGWIEARKLHFLLVGDGLKMPLVRQLLDHPGVARHVTLTGLVAQSEAAKYLACSDLLISPHVPNSDGSEFFGSPTKLFEYMAMEKPIVASALGQIAEVVSGRGATRLGTMPPGAGELCGFLFEPGNAPEFKKVLHQVVDDLPSAAKTAQAARQEILNRYTWPRHVDAILNRMIENRLLARQPKRSVA